MPKPAAPNNPRAQGRPFINVARDTPVHPGFGSLAYTPLQPDAAVVGPDATAPSVPANLSATAVSTSQINLSWNASSDPTVGGELTSGLAGYKVYRNGSFLTTLGLVTSYQSTGLNAGTNYTYQVSAIDNDGNESARSTQAQATTQSGTAALPEGNGLAASYPADTGITANASVILADKFETYTATSQLISAGPWDNYFQTGNFLLDTGTFYNGARSLRVRMPQTGSEVSNALVSTISPDQATLFLRAYTRYAAGYAGQNSAHNGLRITANYPGPGQIPTGTDFMMVEMQSVNYGEGEPGAIHVYVYHPEQNDNYGENWYPSGRTTNGDGPDGGFGSSFVARPEIIPARGSWLCHELMVKLNTPGLRDGRVAIWQDGSLIADWQNVRFRDSTAVKLDEIQIENGGQSSSRINDKWYDNVVVATQYIGPMAAEAGGGGNVINAASASQSAVAAAIASAAVGDTVQIPAGSASWSGLSLNKAITLKGSGQGVTNISVSNCTFTQQSNGITRIQDISFSKSGGGNNSYGINIEGSWPNREPIVIEQCDFTVSGSAMVHGDVQGGVIVAKCRLYAAWDDSLFKLKTIDGTPPSTSTSWSTNDTIGDRDTTGKLNWYFEDCYGYGGANQAWDADDATRVVWRYNQLHRMSYNSHGLATSQVGVRHWEVYGNEMLYVSADDYNETAQLSNMNWWVYIRGGTGVIWGNAIEDISSSWWGSKTELSLWVRAQTDNSGASYGDVSPPTAWLSAGTGNYPRQHQIAVNRNSGVSTNNGYFIDPVYIWGNTGTGANGTGGVLGLNNDSAGVLVAGRDYFNGGSAKPGYSPYTYPHPLRETTGRAY